MENKKYQTNVSGQTENQAHSSNAAGRNSGVRGPGMRRGGGEKAKNFTGTWKKLILYCKNYSIAIIIAVLCAAGGTIFTLVGPDKLSDLTAVITDGMMTGIDLDAVAGIGFTLIGFYLCSILLSFIQSPHGILQPYFPR